LDTAARLSLAFLFSFNPSNPLNNFTFPPRPLTIEPLFYVTAPAKWVVFCGIYPKVLFSDELGRKACAAHWRSEPVAADQIIKNSMLLV
jgi:hypothetical protein